MKEASQKEKEGIFEGFFLEEAKSFFGRELQRRCIIAFLAMSAWHEGASFPAKHSYKIKWSRYGVIMNCYTLF